MRSHALDAARHSAGLIVLDDEWGARARPLVLPDGSGTIAHLVVSDHTVAPPAAAVARWVDALHTEGFSQVRTGALADSAAAVFAAQGFHVDQELVLLRTDPRRAPRLGPAKTDARGGRPRTARVPADLTIAAEIDAVAFGPAWCIDEVGIADACTATPSHRFRLVGDIGYAVTGRAASSGFLQRLAVRPDLQRSGVGRRLVVDALDWLRRWRVPTAMVNTHVGNDAALALYESVGFTRVDHTLSVMARRLDGSVHP